MTPTTPDGPSRATAILASIGDRVRAARKTEKIPRRILSDRAEVSERHLAQLEAGKGNISVLLLDRIASALDVTLAELVAEPDFTRAPDKGDRIALIGLRGAGKTTLGQRVSSDLGIRFAETNTRVAAEAGLSPAEIFAIYGEDGYRRLEAEVIDTIAKRTGPVILSVGGGIVATPEYFEALLANFYTVWIKATPEEHMTRVKAQGDERPMAGDPHAMVSLRDILERRNAQYSRADATIDTANRSIDDCAKELAGHIRRWIKGGSQ